MTTEGTFPKAPRRFKIREALGYALVAGAVWLGWEVVKAPLMDRGAPALAVRFGPNSPEVLRRAAEAELTAGRFDNAETLSAESLAIAPFNARALRVRGLTEARLGAVDRADEMLTLAGNWSLRDDPAHAWLIENRLRRGDYGSAFAHADTLARRRADLHPSLFNMFTTAANQDPRVLPVLVRLIAANPPWRTAFLQHLHEAKDGAPVMGGMAVALQRTKAPLTPDELQELYTEWLQARRFAGIKEIRSRLGRPPSGSHLQNGNFSADVDNHTYPFGWSLGGGPGITATVVEDDLRPDNTAYRLEYDGFSSGVLLAQLLLLPPGGYALDGEQRSEIPLDDLRLEWSLACAETADETAIYRPKTVGKDTEWRPFSTSFVVPRENCSAQWLRLMPRPDDRRTAVVVWLDNLRIRPSSAAP